MISIHPAAAALGLGIAAAGATLGLGALQAGAQNATQPPIMARPTFEQVDTDKDGSISKAEFQAFVTRAPVHGQGAPMMGGAGMGAHDRHMRQMMPVDIKMLDSDGDGKISLEEFAAPMKTHFAELDTNHDGFLEQTELPLPRDGGMPPAPPPGS